MAWYADINSMTADDWALYEMEDGSEHDVAKQFNEKLSSLVRDAFITLTNGGGDIKTLATFVAQTFYTYRNDFGRYGAADTAVNEVAYYTINKIFNIT